MWQYTKYKIFFQRSCYRCNPSSTWGPVLFSLYRNDLPSVCHGCEIIMYSDDTVIFIKGSNHSEAAAQLSKVTINGTKWLNNCHLQLNTSKTGAMFFVKTNFKKKLCFYLRTENSNSKLI